MLQVLEEDVLCAEQETGLAEVQLFCQGESCRHETVLHWKDKNKAAKGRQSKNDKGTQADITEGNCLKLLSLRICSRGIFWVKCYLCTL